MKSAKPANLGGLVGYNPVNSSIGTSYSTGMPIAHKSPGGGLVGTQTGTVQVSFWDVTTSGTSEGVRGGSDVGITGLTDDEMRSGLPSGFDSKIWGQSPDINNGYPYLLANPPPK